MLCCRFCLPGSSLSVWKVPCKLSTAGSLSDPVPDFFSTPAANSSHTDEGRSAEHLLYSALLSSGISCTAFPPSAVGLNTHTHIHTQTHTRRRRGRLFNNHECEFLFFFSFLSPKDSHQSGFYHHRHWQHQSAELCTLILARRVHAEGSQYASWYVFLRNIVSNPHCQDKEALHSPHLPCGTVDQLVWTRGQRTHHHLSLEGSSGATIHTILFLDRHNAVEFKGILIYLVSLQKWYICCCIRHF